MKCEDLLAALNEYVDGELDPGICDAFQQHLAECNPCQIVVDNIRKTIRLYKAGELLHEVEVPAVFQQKLSQKLHDRWKVKFSRPSGPDV